MEAEFITYEQAVKLSDLGFNEKCFCYYDTCNQFRSLFIGVTPEILKNEGVVAPLKQQVFRWFRENNNYSYYIKNWSRDLDNWTFNISTILTINNKGYEFDSYCNDLNFRTYKEAETACIDKLISLIEKNN